MGIFRKPLGMPLPEHDPIQVMQTGAFAPAISPAMPNIATPAIKPQFFDKGGTGRQIAGILGDALLGATGQPPLYAQLVERHRQQEREDARLRIEQEREDRAANKPQVVPLGNGGIATVGPDGQMHVIREPQAQQGENERLLDQWSQLPDTDPRKPMIERMVRGAAYDPDIQGPIASMKAALAQQAIAARAAASAALKAQPTYAQAHPAAARPGAGASGRVTATARAKYINDAEAAISRGAPRDKVYARLRQMGIQ